jgi:hypothetical protein
VVSFPKHTRLRDKCLDHIDQIASSYIARTGNDQRLDAIAIRLRTFGVLDQVSTHHITPFSSV